MSKNSRGTTTVKCPVCSNSVRADRIRVHLGTVHPGFKAGKEFTSKVHDLEATERIKSRGNHPLASFFTTWRIVGLVVMIVVAGVLVYAVTRPGPASVVTGKPAPDFTFTDMGGGSHTLSLYQGHPVLLWWICTWCSHCQAATQVFAGNYYSEYHAAGIAVLELQLYQNLGDSGPPLTNFVDANGYSGQAGWVVGSGPSDASTLYDGGQGPDIYFLIDSHGVVIAQGSGVSSAFASLYDQAQGR